MKITPKTREANQLMLEGTQALARASATGLRIDMDYLRTKMRRIDHQTARLQQQINRSDLGRRWEKKFKGDKNLGSNDQLADVLYNDMGIKPSRFTETGKPSTDQTALEALRKKVPEVDLLVKYNRLLKAKGTFLTGIEREAVQNRKDGLWYLHPFFKLHSVQTFRSSSSNINFQNIPKRVKEIKQIVRRCFVPRPGNVLLSIDFSGAEIRGGYCYHKDPNMYKEIIDPKCDMHRDVAMDVYKLSHKELGEKGTSTYSELRHHGGKNGFVFPEFYGDYYLSCAENMWDAIDLHDLTTAQGLPLLDHLSNKGIYDFEDFAQHVKGVEHRFWKKRFRTYDKWRADWYKKYVQAGYVDMLTGFRCQGHMTRNQCINYPVQGSSFHFLLWSFIQIDRIAREEGWKSKVLGQIHDEGDLDVCPDELDHVVETCKRVMTKDLPEHWKWICVPLEVEAEVSKVDGNWNEMEAYKRAA